MTAEPSLTIATELPRAVSVKLSSWLRKIAFAGSIEPGK
jgi:hypothetical protein